MKHNLRRLKRKGESQVKINHPDITSKIHDIMEQGAAKAIFVDAEGSLILKNQEGKQAVIPAYVLYFQGKLYLGQNERRSHTELVPIEVGAKCHSKLVLLNKEEKSADFISRKKLALEETKFLLWTVYPRGVELCFVTPLDRHFHSRTFGITAEELRFAEALVRLLLESFDKKVLEEYLAFYNVEEENGF